MEMRIRDADGHMLTDGEDMVGRFRSYIDKLFNVDEGWDESLSSDFKKEKKLFERKPMQKERPTTKWRCESEMRMVIC